MRVSTHIGSALIAATLLTGLVTTEALAQQQGGRGDTTRTQDPANCQRDLREARTALDQQDMVRARDQLDRASQTCCPDQTQRQDRIHAPSR